MPDPLDPKPSSSASDAGKSRLGVGLSMGMELLAGVGLGVLVGWWLDKSYGWSPWGVLVGSSVGFAGGMYLLIKSALRL